MQEPRPGRSPLVIRFASPSGKYELFGNSSVDVQVSYLLLVVTSENALYFAKI